MNGKYLSWGRHRGRTGRLKARMIERRYKLDTYKKIDAGRRAGRETKMG